ncbi:MAG: methylglyoxal synthase [Bacteroidetes bacterium]|nr:methylglyoxal synthase [Bacteroidota bacterium]MBU1113699.1 methylglyoxal synthase [Bacteroidota bacterium]MBU1798054.1 methylglyoxal synthase [Bacteroidota bacterium]
MNKTIALVAHDNRKKDLAEWVSFNAGSLMEHKMVCTGTTGKMIERILKEKNLKNANIKIKKLKSGPLGGDQQLGAMIAEGKIDIIIFFWDPMEPQPHDVDVKALLRISVLYNIPIANNRSTADFIISSQLFEGEYTPILKDYSKYLMRNVIL